MLKHVRFQVKRSKVRVTQVVQNFCHVTSKAHFLFDRFASYLAHIQTMRWWCVMPHFQVKRWKLKVIWVIQSFSCVHFCCVRSVALCLFDRFASYVAQIQPMKGWCVLYQVKRSKVKITQSFKLFTVSALWLHAYLTDSFCMQHKYDLWEEDVSRTIARSKEQGHGLCEVLAMFAPWLCVTLVLKKKHEGLVRPFPGQNVRGQGHTGCSKFLQGLLCSCRPIWMIHYIYDTIHEVTMCQTPFPGQKVKVTWFVWSFCHRKYKDYVYGRC